MQKRLRYAMPRKPLSKYKENDAENDAETTHGVTGATGTNVGVMAKRIRQMEREKRQVYQPPAEGLLAGDLPSSDSDQSETDSADNAPLIDE